RIDRDLARRIDRDPPRRIDRDPARLNGGPDLGDAVYPDWERTLRYHRPRAAPFACASSLAAPARAAAALASVPARRRRTAKPPRLPFDVSARKLPGQPSIGIPTELKLKALKFLPTPILLSSTSSDYILMA